MDRIKQLKQTIEGKLNRYYGKDTRKTPRRKRFFRQWPFPCVTGYWSWWVKASEEMEQRGMKTLYYMSAEFLMGRALVNNMINLGLLEDYRTVMAEIGFPFEKLEEQENEAGLGKRRPWKAGSLFP